MDSNVYMKMGVCSLLDNYTFGIYCLLVQGHGYVCSTAESMETFCYRFYLSELIENVKCAGHQRSYGMFVR